MDGRAKAITKRLKRQVDEARGKRKPYRPKANPNADGRQQYINLTYRKLKEAYDKPKDLTGEIWRLMLEEFVDRDVVNTEGRSKNGVTGFHWGNPFGFGPIKGYTDTSKMSLDNALDDAIEEIKRSPTKRPTLVTPKNPSTRTSKANPKGINRVQGPRAATSRGAPDLKRKGTAGKSNRPVNLRAVSKGFGPIPASAMTALKGGAAQAPPLAPNGIANSQPQREKNSRPRPSPALVAAMKLPAGRAPAGRKRVPGRKRLMKASGVKPKTKAVRKPVGRVRKPTHNHPGKSNKDGSPNMKDKVNIAYAKKNGMSYGKQLCK